MLLSALDDSYTILPRKDEDINGMPFEFIWARVHSFQNRKNFIQRCREVNHFMQRGSVGLFCLMTGKMCWWVWDKEKGKKILNEKMNKEKRSKNREKSCTDNDGHTDRRRQVKIKMEENRQKEERVKETTRKIDRQIQRKIWGEVER